MGTFLRILAGFCVGLIITNYGLIAGTMAVAAVIFCLISLIVDKNFEN